MRGEKSSGMREKSADSWGQHQYPQNQARSSSATTATEPADQESDCTAQQALQLNHWLNLGADSIVSRDRRMKSLQLILKISATYRLVCYLPANIWLNCSLRTEIMILHGQKHGSLCLSLFSSLRQQVLYIMTLTSDIDRFTNPHYGSGAFATNDTIAMEQANC